mgnify:CR=1 FL=1
MIVAILLIVILAALGLSYWHKKVKKLLTSVFILITLLVFYSSFFKLSQLDFVFIFLTLMLSVLLVIKPLRQQLLTRHLYRYLKKTLPTISNTEQVALNASDTHWDAELFSGNPNWDLLQQQKKCFLTEEEQAFLDGPTEQLCRLLDDWEITFIQRDLSEEIWKFIKKNKFCGLIIPKKYHGLEFSHYAHSAIVMKLSSRCASAAVSVMVPNSLGPAKLLLNYGTEQQKNYFLPRLATGQELPCFALTGPHAGSDAGSMPDHGVICYGSYQGKKNILGIKLNWEKRYITLGPIATLIGLAFKLYDPDKLIGDHENIGITVALLPSDLPGISIGKRHFPLDAAFQNGPNWGHDVFVPIDHIIGGVEQAGNGWKMLMECLAIGRSISLPSLSVGAAKYTCRNIGAYARIRKQFNIPIGDFEGIKERLSHMAGETYIMDAARHLTLSALDNGYKPTIISAIVKYELTERMRRIVNDGMDIQGGAGICLGPTNIMGRIYQSIPISITVEGANILTRTLIIFGQGAIVSHPYIQQELHLLQDHEGPKTIQKFDTLFFQHIGFILHNIVATLWYAISNARFLKVPGKQSTRKYYQRMTRQSCLFILFTDIALLSLGESLKRREIISGLFADALSNLYLGSAVLKHFHDQGQLKEDLPLMHWSCQQTTFKTNQAFLSLINQIPSPIISWFLKHLLLRDYRPPDNHLTHSVSDLLLSDNDSRNRLTEGIYINHQPHDATGRIENALSAVIKAEVPEKKILRAQRFKKLKHGTLKSIVEQALSENIISKEEAHLVIAAEDARSIAISVDCFNPEQLTGPNSKTQ